MIENDILLSTSQSARLIGAHESSVKRWCNAGDLSCTLTDGGHRRIPLDRLLAFARERGLASSLLALAPHEHAAARALLEGLSGAGTETLVELGYEWLRASASRQPVQLFRLYVELGCSFETLCDEVLAPILHRVGTDWFEGRLDVGEEHRITQVILDALHGLRLEAEQAPKIEGRVAVIGCEEGNRHELGAQMVRLVLVAAGWQVVYLGANVPAEDLSRQQSAHGARLVCVSLTPPAAPPDARRLLHRLAGLYQPGQPYRLVLGGSTVRGVQAPEASSLPFAECCYFDSIVAFAGWLHPLSLTA